GVLGENFHSYPPADVWLPQQLDPASTNQGHYLSVAALLKPGVTLEAANARLKIWGDHFRRQYPRWMQSDESVSATPLKESMVGDTRQALLILTSAVGFVLVIDCAHVATLLLARAEARAKKIAVRTARGASRWRIV